MLNAVVRTICVRTMKTTLIAFSVVHKMILNSILEELHAARRTILADYDGDTKAYLRDAQVRLEASGRPIWQGKQRTIRRNGTEKPGVSKVGNLSSPPADR